LLPVAQHAALLRYLNPLIYNGTAVKLQLDQRLVFKAEWEDGVERLKGARAPVRELAEIAERKEPELPKTASGEAMPRLNIGKVKTPSLPVKRAPPPQMPSGFKLPPRASHKSGK
jgi:transcription-repair coupling factor (superfamily II helicase)